MGYTTADLLNSVLIRAMIPDASSGSFSPANLLQLATEELQSVIAPLILSAREKYYETYLDQPMIGGQSLYAIPPRAVGSTVSVVQFIYNSKITELVPLDPNECTTTNTVLIPKGFYFQDGGIVLYPTPNTTLGTLRMRYFQRTSRLDLITNAAQVQSFNPVANTITCVSVPSTWTIGTVVDFIPATLPYSPYATNTTLTGVSGAVLSVSALPANLSVGDYIDLAEFTPIPGIPQEFFVCLAQATAVKALEAMGDMQKIQQAQTKLDGYMATALKLITPRDVLTPKKVKSNWQNF